MTDAPPPYPGINGYNGYVGAAAGIVSTAPPAMDGAGAQAKAAEANLQQPQNGWVNPNDPHSAYIPQPAAYEKPPPYNDNWKKDN